MGPEAHAARPLIGPNTRVLAIMNGLGIEEALATTLNSSLPIFGGMAFTCINRGEPGVVNHLKYGPVQVSYALGATLPSLSTPPPSSYSAVVRC